jgi:hypothetical protein
LDNGNVPAYGNRFPVKIFGIGFHRTGTRSLYRFLNELGFRSIHWPAAVCEVDYLRLIEPIRDHREHVVATLRPLIDAFEGFTDVPFPALYVELERAYPNSKFILVSRSMPDWWSSLKRHWRWDKSTHTHEFGSYEYIQYNRYTTAPLRKVDPADREVLIGLHVDHIASVAAHFADRPERLLHVDVEDPEIGARIAAFVDLPQVTAYPHIGTI